MIVQPFPPPPPLVARALLRLRVLAGGDPQAITGLGDIPDLAKPWDPATCAAELRREVWAWCESVAEWINHEYVWRSATLIPECWPEHRDIARGLPVLACLRAAAEGSLRPDLIEQWDHVTLPSFLSRLEKRLDNSCSSGKHTEWPARARYDTYTRTVTVRRQLFDKDTRPDSTQGGGSDSASSSRTQPHTNGGTRS